jgi:hypothetical protein
MPGSSKLSPEDGSVCYAEHGSILVPSAYGWCPPMKALCNHLLAGDVITANLTFHHQQYVVIARMMHVGLSSPSDSLTASYMHLACPGSLLADLDSAHNHNHRACQARQ